MDERSAAEEPDAVACPPTGADGDEENRAARQITPEARAAYIETSIQQAIRRGDFDDLPGAGKPLVGLSDRHDPDWWIRRKIEREQLTGLGPPALTLRTEYAALEASIDRLGRADDVREHLVDFNARVVDARRQLLGGPPVVTPTVDVEEAVLGWQRRRADRVRAQAAAREAARSSAPERVSWRERRRRRRGEA